MKWMCSLVMAAIAMSSVYVSAQSSIGATTDDGRKVLLSQDGTWKYAPAASDQKDASVASFEKGGKATEVLSINKGMASVSYDPNLWKATNQEDPTKTTFTHKSGDAYAMVIGERIESTLDGLKELALANARKAASSLTILKEEKRLVNGSAVLYLKFEPTIQGITFIFEGYYYAGPAGTIQLLTYTGKNLLGEYESDMLDFLNGFEIAPAKK
jgi:hypothetical protein